MADSLQDQLRALGLAREKRSDGKAEKRGAGRSGEASRKPRRPKQQAPSDAGGEPSLEQAWAARQRAEQQEAERARREREAEQRRRREINRALKAIVDAHRLNDDGAEVPFNFLYRGRIRKLYVTPDQQRGLSADELGIAYVSGSFHLLDAVRLGEIRGISAEHVVELGGGDEEPDEIPPPPASG